jgi:hypothetical protein
VNVKQRPKQHHPDFLLTWRPASLKRQACEPEGDEVNLSSAQQQAAASEAEALHLWLAAGGDLALAFLYDLDILVDDETSSSLQTDSESTHLMANQEQPGLDEAAY